MTSKDLFEVVVRTAGIVFIYSGLSDTLGAILHILGLSWRLGITPLQDAAAAVGYFVVGGFVILIAPSFVRLVYGRDRISN